MAFDLYIHKFVSNIIVPLVPSTTLFSLHTPCNTYTAHNIYVHCETRIAKHSHLRVPASLTTTSLAAWALSDEQDMPSLKAGLFQTSRQECSAVDSTNGTAPVDSTTQPSTNRSHVRIGRGVHAVESRPHVVYRRPVQNGPGSWMFCCTSVPYYFLCPISRVRYVCTGP